MRYFVVFDEPKICLYAAWSESVHRYRIIPEGIFDRLESLFAMFSNQITSLLQFFRLSLSKSLCSFADKSKSNFMSL